MSIIAILDNCTVGKDERPARCVISFDLPSKRHRKGTVSYIFQATDGTNEVYQCAERVRFNATQADSWVTRLIEGRLSLFWSLNASIRKFYRRRSTELAAA